jgi:hypothetical protein
VVAYLPSGVVSADQAAQVLDELLAAAPVARVKERGVSTGGAK